MRFWDIFMLAFRGLHKGWAAIAVLGIAMSVVCFSFAGADLFSVHSEKAKPCELAVQASDTAKLSDQSVLDILKIPNVTAATGTMEVPVTLSSGKYSAELTLYGIDRNYLQNGFTFGGPFPENSVMPYIVLNSAAVKEFIDKNNPPADQDDYAPAINWENARIELSFGGDNSSSKEVTSKICGILQSRREEETPAGYISISMAKTLLTGQKTMPGYTSIAVRLKDTGAAKNVVEKIGALGYSASDPSMEQQAKWDRQEMEISNLILVGVIGLLCFSFLIAAIDRGNLLEEHRQLEMLCWIGMPISKRKAIYFIKTAIIDIVGVLLGIAASTCIPSFVPEEQMATSVFFLAVPYLVTAVISPICIALFLLPASYANRKIAKSS